MSGGEEEQCKTWSREEVFSLLEDYQQYPVLWDPKNRGYKDRFLKQDLIRELAHKYGTTSNAIEEKLRNLRITFQRQKRRAATSMRNNKKYIPTWFAYEAMLFLPTTTTIPIHSDPPSVYVIKPSENDDDGWDDDASTEPPDDEASSETLDENKKDNGTKVPKSTNGPLHAPVGPGHSNPGVSSCQSNPSVAPRRISTSVVTSLVKTSPSSGGVNTGVFTHYVSTSVSSGGVNTGVLSRRVNPRVSSSHVNPIASSGSGKPSVLTDHVCTSVASGVNTGVSPGRVNLNVSAGRVNSGVVRVIGSSSSEQPVKKFKNDHLNNDADLVIGKAYRWMKSLQGSAQFADKWSTYGMHVANQLRDLTPQEQIMAMHNIDNILFEASMKNFSNIDASVACSSSQNSTSIIVELNDFA